MSTGSNIGAFDLRGRRRASSDPVQSSDPRPPAQVSALDFTLEAVSEAFGLPAAIYPLAPPAQVSALDFTVVP